PRHASFASPALISSASHGTNSTLRRAWRHASNREPRIDVRSRAMSKPVLRGINPREIKAMLADGGELALLDVREELIFSRGHLLQARPRPVSRLELPIRALVPRRATRIVLVDDGDGLAQRAAGKLAELGYTDVASLDGGVAAWTAAGFELFSGINVPSK